MSPSSAPINGDRQQQAEKSPSPSELRDDFEMKVRRAKIGAILVSVLHQLSRFFGLCALTWATVVLLGGFAASLRTLDFFMVSSLLLLEGARLVIVHAFSNILSRTLFRESDSPEEFKFKDMQSFIANLLNITGQVMSSLLASTTLVSGIARFIFTRSHGLSGNSSDKGSNLVYALYIFYVLVMGNSFLAILSGLLRPWLRCRCDGEPSQNCLMAFHDEVYKKAINVGFQEADQIDILEFAYTKLSSDYRRNIRPPLIKAQNKDLIRYLYHNQQGIAMACEYLSSTDVWKQVVAANLPGFWVEESKIELQVALFWALRRKMYGAGKDAESALNSIEALGKKWAAMSKPPHPFLINAPDSVTNNIVHMDSATNIVDTLVQLLLKPIRPTLLFQLRAFEACCRNSQVVQHLYGGHSPEEAQEMCQELQNMIVSRQQEKSEAPLQELCRKLFKDVKENGIRTTTKIYAGNALLSLLRYGTGKVGEEAMKSLREPVEKFLDPAKEQGNGRKRPYFWLEEMILVEEIREQLQLGMYQRWEGVRIRSPDGTKLPLERALEECGRARQVYKL